MIDFLIKQQTAWSQGSSKYQKQKKCTRSEFYVYIIPKRNTYSSNSNTKKRKMATILKLAIKNIYPNYQRYNLYQYRSKC